MEGFNFTNVSHNNISDSDGIKRSLSTIKVVACIIISIGLCLILVAMFAVCSLVRKNHVAPIYVINLLISDLIQLCCLIIWLAEEKKSITYIVGSFLYNVGLMASVGFMVCIALERYLVIACPLWYRFRHTIKFSVVLCVMVWVLSPVLFVLTLWVPQDRYITNIIMGTSLLLPLPLFIFFLGGTIRALSASRVPSDEKRRIVGILVLVLLMFTLLFMPKIIYRLAKQHSYTLNKLSFVFVQLSPLADAFLYVFMRKGTIDKLLATVCCCRMDSNDSSRMDSNDITSSTV
ncbi:psychosine receptor-like [Sparus aurata]|uniref:psychosine receptor-like n=1 Tax=Sparus aurata TaxID=8175 RepID=UPI0011C14F5A|nr:psychosine receptor-like [Sparus aurata]